MTNDPQKKYRLGTVRKIFSGGLKPVSRCQPHPGQVSMQGVSTDVEGRKTNYSCYIFSNSLANFAKVFVQRHMRLIPMRTFPALGNG